MRVFPSLTGFFRDLRSQRLRMVLTVLGITWGTVGIVLLLAFGEGVRKETLKEQRGMGDGIVILWPRRTTMSYGGYGKGRELRVRQEDVLRLATEVPELEAVSPEFYEAARVSHAGKSRRPWISGVYPVYGSLRHLYPQPGGRFIHQPDLDERRRVAFLGNRIAEELLGKGEAVGKTIVINHTPFRVIGVMQAKEQSGSYLGRDENMVFVPASTWRTLFAQEPIDNFIYRAEDPRQNAAAMQKVYASLARRYQFDPADSEALDRWDTTEQNRFFFYFFSALNLLMGVGGAFTLCVGGIGVANIMFIIVSEKTPEIGIKMAVGAKPRHIMIHFLAQAVFLTAIGGGLGFLISLGAATLVGMTPMSEHIGVPTVSPLVTVLTVFLLGVVGVLAGWFPARRAAGLEPVRALGY